MGNVSVGAQEFGRTSFTDLTVRINLIEAVELAVGAFDDESAVFVTEVVVCG